MITEATAQRLADVLERLDKRLAQLGLDMQREDQRLRECPAGSNCGCRYMSSGGCRGDRCPARRGL